MISTNTNFKIVSCGLGQLLAEPGGGHTRWWGQIAAGRRSTALTIPNWVACIQYIVPPCWARIPTFTEVVISYVGGSSCSTHTGTVIMGVGGLKKSSCKAPDVLPCSRRSVCEGHSVHIGTFYGLWTSILCKSIRWVVLIPYHSPTNMIVTDPVSAVHSWKTSAASPSTQPPRFWAVSF